MSTFVTALAIGSVYALVAMGYNVIYLTTSLFNFAQGAIVAIASLVAYSLVASVGLPVLVALPICALAGLAVSVIQWALSVAPVTASRNDTQIWLVSTVGAFVMLEAIAQLTWGSEPRGADGGVLEELVDLGDGSVKVAAFVAIGAAVVAALGIDRWYAVTRAGKISRAVAQDREAAEARGINTRRVALGSFALAGVLAGIAGLILMPLTFARADLGSLLVIKAFVAMALGGFGSVRGALLGGWAIGLVETYGASAVGVEYEELLVFALLLAVLLTVPGGLFGVREERRV